MCRKGSGAVTGKTDLATTHPLLAKEWDYTKNEDLTPQKVKAGSNHDVWWKCPTCQCSYHTQIVARTKGRNCPNCNDTGLVEGYNDFQTLHPDLAKEWHPTKNTKKPNQIKSQSRYKAFWQCPVCGSCLAKSGQGSRYL
ncbi:zinc-ribbon domain-containing protein [Candidatus Avelusimicrobium fimicolum]|uniref:zinc-ribbon domain-containing protein n=1 Tax=Candidatus Avelusimicrobium fimicolum TaxID=3416216 RepID=UPI003D0BD8E3